MEAFIAAGGLPEYYRCEIANKTQEEWYLEGEQNIYHGVFCLLYYLVCQSLYIPCMIVFTQKDLISLPVYKLMLFISLCDTANLIVNSLLTGIFFIQGAVYCNYPTFIYIWGCIEMCGWSGCCIGCFFLVLTRLVDLISPHMHEVLFAGKRMAFSFAIMFSYMLHFLFFVKPILFNSKARTWLFDPMIYPDGRNYKEYACLVTVINNTATVSSTLFLYLAFFAIFAYKMKKSYNFKMDSKQKTILLQSCLICLNNLALALIYVAMQYLPIGPAVLLAALLTWQFSSGGGVIVFLGINKTVRRRVLTLLGGARFVKNSTIQPQTPSKSHNYVSTIEFH